MWIEIVAYDASDDVVFESGRIGDGELEEKPVTDAGYDPQLSLFRDWIYGADGAPTRDFWRAAPSVAYPDGYTALTLPFTVDPAVPHTVSARYAIARYREIARMTVRLRMRPIGVDVLNDLVDSGDLDSSTLASMPTFTLYGAAVEWRRDEAALRSLIPDDLPCAEAQN